MDLHIDQLTLADWFGIAGFFISIIFGFLNIWYTRRSFFAAYYPKILLSIQARHYESGTCLHFGLNNVSTGQPVINGMTDVYIRNPEQSWFLWRKRWLLAFSLPKVELKPGELKWTPDSSILQSKSIEKFLSKQFPALMVEQPTSQIGAEYIFHRPQNLKFKTTIQFESGIHAKSRKIVQFFQLKPICVDTHGRQILSHWQVIYNKKTEENGLTHAS